MGLEQMLVYYEISKKKGYTQMEVDKLFHSLIMTKVMYAFTEGINLS